MQQYFVFTIYWLSFDNFACDPFLLVLDNIMDRARTFADSQARTKQCFTSKSLKKTLSFIYKTPTSSGKADIKTTLTTMYWHQCLTFLSFFASFLRIFFNGFKFSKDGSKYSARNWGPSTKFLDHSWKWYANSTVKIAKNRTTELPIV